jgi:hypothetical protein
VFKFREAPIAPVHPVAQMKPKQSAAAPPVYRPSRASGAPQSAPMHSVAQMKPKQSAAAPPVYRPNRVSGAPQPAPVHSVAQMKPKQLPAAPPIYRPNRAPGASQPGPVYAVAQMKSKQPAAAPPVYRPNRASGVAAAAPHLLRGNGQAEIPPVYHNHGSFSANSSSIQRKIVWTEEEVRHFNIARIITLEHEGGEPPEFGVTPILINNEEFPPTKQATLMPPTFQWREIPGTWLRGKRVELSVQSEAINVVGYKMKLPSDNIWESTCSRDQVFSYIRSWIPLREEDNDVGTRGEETVIVEASAKPNKRDFFECVKRHESVHAEETRGTVQKYLAPWDAAIRKFMENKETVVETTKDKAIETFYKKVGGTPEQIGSKFLAEAEKLGNDFHRTPRGQNPGIHSYEVVPGARDRVIVFFDAIQPPI